MMYPQIISRELHGKKFRSISIEDVIWYKGVDVCNQLGFSNGSQTIQSYVSHRNKRTISLGKGRSTWFITIEGVYELWWQSRNTSGVRFRQFVCNKVLPKTDFQLRF